jgi:hypothetical protein
MADPAIPQQSIHVVDLESSWGVEKGGPAGFKIAPRPNVGVKRAVGLIANDSIRADFNANEPVFDVFKPDGRLVMVASDTETPYWAEIFCGNRTTTGAGDPYTHVSKITAAGPKSFVLDQFWNLDTDKYAKSNGTRISSWGIDFSAAGLLTFDFGLAAKSVTIGGSTYSAAPTDWTANSPLDHLKLSGAVSIGGGAVTYVRSGRINFNPNLTMDDYAAGGAGVRASLVPGIHEVTGELVIRIDSATAFTLLQSSTATSLALTWTRTTNRSFAISLGNVFIEQTSPVIDGAGAVYATVAFRAAYKAADSSQAILTTVNGTAGTIYV